MVNIRFLVTDFASHRTWIEGYQRHHGLQHDVRITYVKGDRWKFRMMAAAAELEDEIALDDEILVVDAMLDVTVLVALLKSSREGHQCPSIYMYFHENQLTTPFTSQDRDYHKGQQTHWHYGMAHWRSLLVADGCIFNSLTHLNDFAEALPKCLNEQCPRDAVEWQLTKCRDLLSTKCTVLRYGLGLDELVALNNESDHTRNVEINEATNQRTPVILWNARLEEDKNPGAFLDLLRQTANKTAIPFRIIILGTDPSKERKWYTELEQTFGDRILFMGWCQDRKDYARYLSKSSIVVSTANHETFGISIVESAYCGALPLLPRQLSYPEIFDSVPNVNERYLYKQIGKDAVTKLIKLFDTVASSDTTAHKQAQVELKRAAALYRWKVMGPVYDHFFSNLANGEMIVEAGREAATLATALSPASVDTDVTEVKRDRTTDLGRSVPTTTGGPLHVIHVVSAEDLRIQLFRPKSLRNHKEYNQQLSAQRSQGIEPALHGGRRAITRMLEAIDQGANLRPISFLTIPELAESVLLNNKHQQSFNKVGANLSPPVYIADKDLLNTIRGQKLNAGDAILAMVQFPIASALQEVLDNPPILILENVRNAENIGSILRTAFCLGIRSIVAAETAWAALKDNRAARCSMGTMYYHRYYKASGGFEIEK
jgi:glycosyltransferase involved in cell wall biosynthesis